MAEQVVAVGQRPEHFVPRGAIVGIAVQAGLNDGEIDLHDDFDLLARVRGNAVFVEISGYAPVVVVEEELPAPPPEVVETPKPARRGRAKSG